MPMAAVATGSTNRKQRAPISFCYLCCLPFKSVHYIRVIFLSSVASTRATACGTRVLRGGRRRRGHVRCRRRRRGGASAAAAPADIADGDVLRQPRLQAEVADFTGEARGGRDGGHGAGAVHADSTLQRSALVVRAGAAAGGATAPAAALLADVTDGHLSNGRGAGQGSAAVHGCTAHAAGSRGRVWPQHMHFPRGGGRSQMQSQRTHALGRPREGVAVYDGQVQAVAQ